MEYTYKELIEHTKFFTSKFSEICIGGVSGGWFRVSSDYSFKRVNLGKLYNYYEECYISIYTNSLTAKCSIKQICLITVEGEFIVFDTWESFKDFILKKI
jgi:hypothetical protein